MLCSAQLGCVALSRYNAVNGYPIQAQSNSTGIITANVITTSATPSTSSFIMLKTFFISL